MGATLSYKANTTAPGRQEGKLEYSPQNEALLLKVLNYVETVVEKHPKEAEAVFIKPFTWTTSIRPSLFEEKDPEQQKYTTRKDLVTSYAATNDEPHLILQQVDHNKFNIKAYTFEQLYSILQISGDIKLEEIRKCLEENKDPMANIMGGAFARVESNDNALVKANQMLSQAREDGSENLAEMEHRFRLLLLINQLDLELLFSSVSELAKDVRLSPEAVEREFKVINSFSGSDDDCFLQSLSWIYDYVFDNGCRAPPWRQVHGDIAYLEAETKENEKYSITASAIGYYLNGGLDAKSEVVHERSGDIYPTLSDLLKAKSTHYSSMCTKQAFTYHEKGEIKGQKKQTRAQSAGQEKQLQQESGEERNKSAESNKGQGSPRPISEMAAKKKKLKANERKEPSSKWKQLDLVTTSLGDEESRSKAERKSGKKSSKKAPEKASKTKGSSVAGQIDENFSESSSESEEEEDAQDRRQESHADLPSEYWQIQKLVKYLKGGNQTATVIALCAMHDFNLGQETCQLAIRDVGGLEVLINLLETKEIKCKIGSLKILKEISCNSQIRQSIADLGGLQTMVSILQTNNKHLKSLAAETIANVAKFRRARRTVRQYGGILKLTALLDSDAVGTGSPEDIGVARAGALALWSCSKSTKNKEAIKRAGGIPLLARLLKSDNESLLIPVVGTLQECASEKSYRLAIRTEGMIGDLVRNLKSEDPELQKHCASAIFKCAEDSETRDLVREFGGLDPLVALLGNSENKELLAAVTGAIWKCAISEENVIRFQELKAIEQLVTLLTDQPEEVLINVVGALGECAKILENRLAIRKSGGIAPMVNLLTGTNQQLLVNVTRAVGKCAMEPDNMTIIDRLDGVRLLWSLLKSSNPEVQSNAAWAICPCIENAKDAGEMVRSFVGGLELIVSLLKSDDKEVLASVCAAIANIAKDEENLAVITDHGVVPMLAKLTYTWRDLKWICRLSGLLPRVGYRVENMISGLRQEATQVFLFHGATDFNRSEDETDDKLRHHLAEAIARCCSWGNNRVSFGQAGAVPPLVRYLKSKHLDVHRSTAKALYQLSRDPNNCIAMHSSGVVKPLMTMVGSSDDTLQEASAGCLGNIRRLALANEKARYH